MNKNFSNNQTNNQLFRKDYDIYQNVIITNK